MPVSPAAWLPVAAVAAAGESYALRDMGWLCNFKEMTVVKRLRESQRMLFEHPKIRGALEEIGIKYEHSMPFYPGCVPYGLKPDQRMMIHHMLGYIDWNQRQGQIANKFGFSRESITQLHGYLQLQEDISKVVGWEPLIELIVFVIQGRYGCSINGFYQGLFLKIKYRPKEQSDIMDGVIQGIREGRRFRHILEDLGLK